MSLTQKLLDLLLLLCGCFLVSLVYCCELLVKPVLRCLHGCSHLSLHGFRLLSRIRSKLLYASLDLCRSCTFVLSRSLLRISNCLLDAVLPLQRWLDSVHCVRNGFLNSSSYLLSAPFRLGLHASPFRFGYFSRESRARISAGLVDCGVHCPLNRFLLVNLALGYDLLNRSRNRLLLKTLVANLGEGQLSFEMFKRLFLHRASVGCALILYSLDGVSCNGCR
mmetsp:Transcript_3634/g.6068  ORF Transcript_3634/g.6068 Transcript_3634/m.6068 type:complete len:222 (-) Transcript_3634:2924-3589(-)